MATRRTIEQLNGFFASGQPARSITPDRVQDLIKTAMVSDSVHVVRSVDDLPDPVGDQVTLPAGKTVLLAGAINLGSDALRLSTGTLLRGFGGDSIQSSNANGVIRATDLGAAVVMREFSVIATGGPAFALQGTIEHQLNLFFMGVFGASAGTITGFDVQAVKSCFIKAADGFTFAGTTNKIFVDGTPFYDIAEGNAGIRLAANLDASVADLVTNFFKFDDGTCIEAVDGYSVGEGKLRGSLIDGTATPLAGLSPADVNWFMRDNTGVRDSRVAAQSFLTEAATTTIATEGVFVPVVGPFELGALAERFEHNGDNELVYTGQAPALVTFNAAFTVDPSNNNRVAFRATKNGTTIAQSQTIVEQGAGPGSSPRAGAVVSIMEVETGDRIGLAVANLAGTANIPWLTATYAVSAG